MTDPILQRLKKQHPGKTVTAKYPEKGPSWVKARKTKYTITDKSGHSVSVSPGAESNEKKYTIQEIIANKFNNNKKP